MRCILDTNTLISALLLKNSVPGSAFRLALLRGVILASTETIAELESVLRRRKFDKYLTSEEKEEFLEALVLRAELVDIVEPVQVCRDPKDDKFLSLAASGAADYIITGDEDLLTIATYAGATILKAKDFVDVAQA